MASPRFSKESASRPPLDPAIAEGGDAGVPIVVAEPDGAHAAAFRSLAEAVARASAVERPKLVIR